MPPNDAMGTPRLTRIAELAFRECTELAFEIADIGVVDVAVDDVSDRVAIDGFAQAVCCVADQANVITPCTEQSHNVTFCRGFACFNCSKDVFYIL